MRRKGRIPTERAAEAASRRAAATPSGSRRLFHRRPPAPPRFAAALLQSAGRLDQRESPACGDPRGELGYARHGADVHGEVPLRVCTESWPHAQTARSHPLCLFPPFAHSRSRRLAAPLAGPSVPHTSTVSLLESIATLPQLCKFRCLTSQLPTDPNFVLVAFDKNYVALRTTLRLA